MSGKRLLLRTVTTAPESAAASPPANPTAPGAWSGHLHATRVALAMIFDPARKPSRALSPNERILAAVCEFRSALACGEWLGRLKTNRLREFAAVRFALNEVGAMSVAACISDTAAALRRARLERHPALLSKLERDLSAAGPALDRLIAKFAQSLLDAGGGAPQCPRTSQTHAVGSTRNHWSSWMRDVKRCGTGRREGSGEG